MRLSSLHLLGTAVLLAGCSTEQSGAKSGTVSDEVSDDQASSSRASAASAACIPGATSYALRPY